MYRIGLLDECNREYFYMLFYIRSVWRWLLCGSSIQVLFIIGYTPFVISIWTITRMFLSQMTAWPESFGDDLYDDVIKRKHFPRYWPFVRRIHR